jgi:tRNA (guanine9-N1)-methyltransferase
VNEEEKQWLESVRERAQEKNSAKIQSRVLMEKAMSDPSSAVTVVMDLDFQDKMEDREIKSLCSQLNFSYGANCQTHNPVHLVFSGMHRDTQVYKHFNDKVDGFSKWLVTCHEDSFSNHFSKDRLVYLSADATEELEDLESGMVYVIGALVDHNRHKGITLQKASDIGIPAKRLRISEELLGASRRILAVNHVFDILLRYMASRDWRESCELAIPSRKQHHHKELQQE